MDTNHEPPGTPHRGPPGFRSEEQRQWSHGRDHLPDRGTVESRRNERVGTDSVFQPRTADSFDNSSFGRANGCVCAASPRLREGARDGPLNTRLEAWTASSKQVHTCGAHAFAPETERRHFRLPAAPSVLMDPRPGLQPPTDRVKARIVTCRVGVGRSRFLCAATQTSDARGDRPARWRARRWLD